MDIAGERLEIVEGFLGAQVACTENVLDLAGYQQFLELGRHAVAAMGNVKIA